MRQVKDTGQRVVVWFSHGAASAVAAKLAIRQYGPDRVVIACVDVGSEHPDNDRFAADCVRWFNHPITHLKEPKYRDTWELWEKRRFLVGPHGAGCTREMKTAVRQRFEDFDDLQVFGFTAEEEDRAKRFRQQNLEVMLATPLIDAGLSKSDCLGMLERAGIELPAMYRLGYRNNNCIGCVKGGMGYWNKIRRDFPEVFARMAALEREIGASVIHDDGGNIWLDELDPSRGNHQEEPDITCSLMCYSAAADLDAA